MNLPRLIIVLKLSVPHCLLSYQQDSGSSRSGILIAQESVVLRADLLLGGKTQTFNFFFCQSIII